MYLSEESKTNGCMHSNRSDNIKYPVKSRIMNKNVCKFYRNKSMKRSLEEQGYKRENCLCSEGDLTKVELN